MKHFFLILALFIFSGCTGLPKDVAPVEDFDLNKYLGKWYEIARLDHSFERGLNNVSASYSLRKDGGIKVLNRGFAAADNLWITAEGRAYFANNEGTGHLKVSFFGPFYSSYVIFELDKEDYEYAFVSGYNTSYLWLLARTRQVEDEIITRFINKAENLGISTEKLLFVHHDQPDK